MNITNPVKSWSFQSAAASWTRRNLERFPVELPAETVSIRRRVVDAAEL